MIVNILGMLALGYLAFALSAVIILIMDKRSIKKMIKGIIMYPIFMASWSILNFVCLFKKNVKWDKIEHVKDISIEQMQRK